MSFNSHHFYDFDGLRFEPENSVLIRLSDQETITLRGKEKLLLLALVKKPNQVVTYDELKQAVWKETTDPQMILHRLQVTKDTLQKKINKLRTANDDFEIIKSAPLKGYIFTLKVEQPEIKAVQPETETEKNVETEITRQHEGATVSTKFENAAFKLNSSQDELGESQIIEKTGRHLLKSALIAVTSFALFALILFIYFSPSEEDEIKRVVKDSQMFESLVLYQNPVSFDENKLKEYWIVEPHNGDLDAVRIRKGATNLIEKGIHYGGETKCEKFDFVSVAVNESRDFAVVKTIESWFVAKYSSDGTLLENKTIGPYAVTYNLRRSNGKWLIEKSNTARAGG